MFSLPLTKRLENIAYNGFSNFADQSHPLEKIAYYIAQNQLSEHLEAIQELITAELDESQLMDRSSLLLIVLDRFSTANNREGLVQVMEMIAPVEKRVFRSQDHDLAFQSLKYYWNRQTEDQRFKVDPTSFELLFPNVDYQYAFAPYFHMEWRLSRLEAIYWMRDNWLEIGKRAAQILLDNRQVVSKGKQIFQYWDGGFDQAPEIVQLINQYNLKNGKDNLVLLTKDNLADYIAIPDVVKNFKGPAANQSDWIRSALLAKYGGAWVDATMIINPSGAVKLIALTNQKNYFVTGRSKPENLESVTPYCMVSSQHHLIARYLQASLEVYMGQFDHFGDYLLVTTIFAFIVARLKQAQQLLASQDYDEDFIVSAMNYFVKTPSHQPDEAKVDALFDAGLVKMTYKYKQREDRATFAYTIMDKLKNKLSGE